MNFIPSMNETYYDRLGRNWGRGLYAIQFAGLGCDYQAADWYWPAPDLSWISEIWFHEMQLDADHGYWWCTYLELWHPPTNQMAGPRQDPRCGFFYDWTHKLQTHGFPSQPWRSNVAIYRNYHWGTGDHTLSAGHLNGAFIRLEDDQWPGVGSVTLRRNKSNVTTTGWINGDSTYDVLVDAGDRGLGLRRLTLTSDLNWRSGDYLPCETTAWLAPHYMFSSSDTRVFRSCFSKTPVSTIVTSPISTRADVSCGESGTT